MVAEAWLYNTLTAGTALSAIIGSANVWNTTAPANVSPTGLYASFGWNGGPASLGVGGTFIMGREVYAVSATGPVGSAGSVYAAGSAIFNLLHKNAGTAAGGTVLSCTYVDALRADFTERGVQYLRVGGYYRIQAQ